MPSYDICSIADKKNCKECTIKSFFLCERGNKKNSIKFYSHLLILIISSYTGLLVYSFSSKNFLILILYTLYWIVYQCVIELFIHCRHCPYFDDANPKIICVVNCGIPKPNWIWIRKKLKFNPKPYHLIEKILLLIFNLLSVIIPTLFIIIGIIIADSILIKYLLVLSMILYIPVTVFFMFMIMTNFCNKCVNIYCPMNRVPEHAKNKYIQKNPVLKGD